MSFQTDFDGNCIMFASTKKLGGAFSIDYGPGSNCNYVIAIHVMFTILYTTVMLGLHIFTIIQRVRKQSFEYVYIRHRQIKSKLLKF